MSNPQKVQVLIIGGGIAGLLAARVLSEYYQEIVIVERDSWPENPGPRPGTPQSFHLHSLQPGGRRILERLFPGYVDDLLALKAYPSLGSEIILINQYGRVVLNNPHKDASCSRGLLEWVIRQRVQALPQVRFLTEQDVVGLLTSADQSRVTGLQLRPRKQAETLGTIEADWVIDTSGSSSKLGQWLQELGYQVPQAEQVAASIGYSTCYYKAPTPANWSVIKVEGDPNTGLGFGVITPIENDTWAAIFSRVGGAAPTTDQQVFESSLANLLDPIIAETLKGATPLMQPRGYRVPAYSRKHFEQMAKWPTGLLVLGDAFSNFNPIYGQGITIAALEAEVLEKCFQEQRFQTSAGFEQQIFRQMQAAIYPAWWLSIMEDLRWPGVRYIGAENMKGAPIIQKCLRLYLTYATLRNGEQLRNQIFPTYMMKYFMMTAFFISPREILNGVEIDKILIAESTSEERQALAALLQDYAYPQESRPLEEVLQEIVPAFSLAFDKQPV